jgi:hypothetical protein
MKINLWDTFFGINEHQKDRFKNQFERFFPFQTQLWGVKDAVWIDTTDAFRLYLDIPELRAVIEKRASMMSSNVPCLYNENGEKIQNHWFYDVLNKPNPTQSWSDVVFSLSVMDALYSSTFAYCPKRSFNVRNLFVPLPSDKVQIKLSGRRLKQMETDGLISGYCFQYDDGKLENIAVDDMVYITTPDGMNLIKPVSRIETLKYPLSNLSAQYHKRNVLLENIGAIGILSAQQNDIGGAIPMTPEEKRQIQRDWFTRSKDELIITESNVNWQPMSYPTRDLLLFEEQTADKLALIDAFGLNYNLFSNEKGSTFQNVRDSIRMVYTDTIIPETQQIYDSIGQQLGLTDEGVYLHAEFDHLPVLQADEEKTANVMKTRAEALEKINNAGVELSEDEKKLILGL